jgi:RNA polymerase sigma-70 factor (ECF subfamily)
VFFDVIRYLLAYFLRRRPAALHPIRSFLSGYFHCLGLKGALVLQLGRAAEAGVAFDQAIALANTAAEAAHIRAHLDRLVRDSASNSRAGASS